MSTWMPVKMMIVTLPTQTGRAVITILAEGVAWKTALVVVSMFLAWLVLTPFVFIFATLAVSVPAQHGTKWVAKRSGIEVGADDYVDTVHETFNEYHKFFLGDK